MKLLFIIGSSRSGSKIVRDALNNIDNVCITTVEFKIMPYIIMNYINTLNTDCINNLKKLYTELESSTYSMSMRNYKVKYNFNSFIENNRRKSSIFEVLLDYICYYENKDPLKIDILGDKTPLYHKHLNTISEINNHVIVHIINMIRDPRDVSLSFKKSWGKSTYRSAFKWNIAVNNVLNSIDNTSLNILTVKYENLLNNVSKELNVIINYLNVYYEKEIGELLNYKSTEKYGSAKGYSGIKTDNINKFKLCLKKSDIESIEGLCHDNMLYHSYDILYSNKQIRPNYITLNYYFIIDNIAYISHIIFKERGLKQGFKFLFKTYKRYSLKN